MKGMEELSEDFLKLLQLAILVVGVLSIFFIFISYNFTVLSNEAQREAHVLGDALLSDVCLTYTSDNKPVKALFTENKLDAAQSDPSCVKYPNGRIDILILDCGGYPNCDWSINIGPHDIGEQAIFHVAVRLDSDDVKLARMTVFI